MDLSMPMPSPAPLVARAHVVDAELDVLFLIIQYLRDLGLSTSAVALLRESGVDPCWLCGPSREIALLREWIFQGEWPRVRALLTPLGDILGERGLATALARVDKQVLLEEFHFAATPPRRRREIVDYLQKPTTHNAARATDHELHCCLQLIRDGASRDGTWSLDEARLGCFESLVPLLRDTIGDDDEENKYLAMPRRQLVALLNDAMLLHEKQSGDGGYDMVAVTPISGDAQLTETESGSSSLRLVEPEEDMSRDLSRDALAQSIDLFQYAAKRQVEGSGGSKLDRSRNPLVMSMAFPGSRRRQAGGHQTGAKGLRVEAADDNETRGEGVADSNNVRHVEDAETQTDDISSVDQALEAFKPPEFPSSLSSEVRNPEAVGHHDRFEPSVDAANDHDSTLVCSASIDRSSSSTPKLSASMASSSTTKMVTADAPLEAWCSSRRGDVPQEPHSPAETDKTLLDRSITTDKHGNWGEPQLGCDEPTLYEDELEGQDDHDDDDHPRVLLRSYSQLTIDSVVRAHVVAEVREAQAIRAMDIAPDGSEMIIGTNARALRVFDLTEPLTSSSSSLSNSSGGGLSSSILPLLPVSLERHKHHASSIYTACYNHISPAHAAPLIATGAAESSIKVLSRWTQQEIWLRGHTGKSRALCFASASLLCSASSGDMVIRAWDLNASETPCVQRLDGHVSEIQAMAITTSHSGHDRQCLVSSSMDRTVRLWDLRSAQCARVLARTASPAFALAFRPQNSATNVLATGHQDGSITLWDLRTSSAKTTKPLATVSHHQSECRAVSWSPNGQWLLSASFDGTLCLLDASALSTLNPVASFHQHHDKILQAQWHPTQPAIVTTGADKLVKLWAFA